MGDGGAIERCIGCGVALAAEEGPTHPYLLSSAACWRMYGEVLAREYGSPRLMRIHRLTVDAYAVQHPGDASPRAVRSVALHLVALHHVFAHGASPAEASALLKRAAGRSEAYAFLAPPAEMGALTVEDVHAAETEDVHEEGVRAWARAAWSAWEPHHARAESWLTAILGLAR